MEVKCFHTLVVLTVKSTNMQRWVGKVAIVTGASAGIGAAIVEELVKHGMKVVGLARRAERIDEIKEKLKGEKGELYALKCDIGNDEDIGKTFKWIEEKFGTVHVLVNNAGIIRNACIRDGHLDDAKDVINVNLISVINLTQKALRLMQDGAINDGHIINIGSVAGHYVPFMDNMPMSVYSASKHALIGLTEGIRQELRYLKLNTKITTISPGAVQTEIGHATARENKGPKAMVFSEEMLKLMASRPMLQSKDVADALIYVLQTPPHVQVHEIIIRPVGDLF